MTDSVKSAPQTLVSKALQEKPSLRVSSPQVLTEALEDFGKSLVMRASADCRVLPHLFHLIGKGGEHLVFEDYRFPNYVLKVDFIESLPVLYAQAKGDAVIRKAVNELEKKAVVQQERLRILASYFLPGSIPLEVFTIKALPLCDAVVRAVIRDRHLPPPKKLEVPDRMPVLCSIQRKFSLPKEHRVDLYSSYAELNRTIPLSFYAEGHRLLASGDPIGSSDMDIRAETIKHIYPSLRSIIRRLHADAFFLSTVRDYIRRVIRYSVDTQEIIDMAGGGNVIFLQTPDQHWRIFLTDALSPPELRLDTIHSAALQIKHGQKLDIRMRAHLLNVINYVRFANAIAMLSGASERLDVSGMTLVSPEQWHEALMIEKYLDVYTPKRG